jgi:hypothetical protein
VSFNDPVAYTSPTLAFRVLYHYTWACLFVRLFVFFFFNVGTSNQTQAFVPAARHKLTKPSPQTEILMLSYLDHGNCSLENAKPLIII